MVVVQGAITVVLFLAILVGLVLIHEVGHFLVARLARIRVHEFGIGFPPRARVLRRRGDTLYTLNWLPIGGFVRLEGEDGDSTDPRSFAVQPLATRLLVLVAGAAMNLLLAFAIFTAIGWFASPYVGVRFWEIDPTSPAAAAGLQPGDAIISVNGQRYEIYGSQNVLSVIRTTAERTVTLGILRDGSKLEVPVTLRPPEQRDETHGALGISGGQRRFEEAFFGEYTGRPLGDAIALGAEQTVRAFGLILGGLGQLVSSVATNPTSAPPVSGPVGIATMVGQVFWQAGPVMTLYLAAILSANLALVNILPIPPLDGGRMLVITLRAGLGAGSRLLGRHGVRVPGPSAETTLTAERLAYLVGFVFIFGFLAWITWFDIARQFGGGGAP